MSELQPWHFRCNGKHKQSPGFHVWYKSRLRPGGSFCINCKLALDEQQTKECFGNA